MNRKTFKAGGLALILALSPGGAKAVQLLSTQDLTIDLGASFEQMGELENTTNNNDALPYKTGTTITMPEYHRDNTRVYLFQTDDRLLLNGNFDGTKFYFEEALGGESVSTSNNMENLYQMYADVPLAYGFSAVVGQFKVPSSLASAEDIRSLMFTEASPLFATFFNQGYDNGVGLKGAGRFWDATVGTVSGAPDLPQRYLPEMFNLPPMLYTRFGIGNIADDPYQQKQAVNHLKESQWGVHLNGEYVNDSNAGHSDDLALQNTDATTVSSANVFGNALLWSNWNPFLGKTSNGVGTSPLHSNYWNASIDSQYRGRISDNLTFIASGQWSFAEFNNYDMQGVAATDDLTSATINLSGGELVAGLASDDWGLAARFDMTLPSDELIYNSAVTSVSHNGGQTYVALPALQENHITGDTPIFELTFPSVTYRVSKYVKLTGEGLFWLNSPEISGDDGVYELLEMPSQVTDLFPGNGTHTNPLVCVGRMALTLAF